MKLEAVPLDIHCYRLGRFIVGQMGSACLPKPRLEDSHIFGQSVCDWLRVAASIEYVSVNTLRFSEGVMYSKDISDYEDARSDLISEILMTQLRFSYVWGAFETLAKILDPPEVPKDLKPRSSMVDRIAYQLHKKYDLQSRAPWGYSIWLDKLKLSLNATDKLYLSRHFTYTACTGYSGLAISIIRHIRNQFAHGIVNLPEPEKWTEEKPNLSLLIELSTRLVLLTMQMMLLTDHPAPQWDDENIPDIDQISLWENCDWRILSILHIKPIKGSNLPLLDDLKND